MCSNFHLRQITEIKLEQYKTNATQNPQPKPLRLLQILKKSGTEYINIVNEEPSLGLTSEGYLGTTVN